MNHGQSNFAMATTRTETTHELTSAMARAIDITAWQYADAICLVSRARVWPARLLFVFVA